MSTYFNLVIGVILLLCNKALAELGDECNSDWECKDFISGSMCHRGRCTCQAFYARINQTTCLQSTLLGYDCVVPQQCSMKVANSSCIDGSCRCVDGFLQFRKHTCLGPARPGNVCYSNEHCRLWSADSHCDFLIPNLFGRCQCNAPYKQLGDSCVRSAFQSASTSTTVGTTTVKILPTRKPTSITTEMPGLNRVTTELDITSNLVKDNFGPSSTASPVTSSSTSTSTTHPRPTTWRKISLSHRSSSKNSANKRKNVTRGTLPPTKSTQRTASSTIPVTSQMPSSTPGIKTRLEDFSEAISLGLPCVTDLQCRASDPSSRCIEGVCDCVVKLNGTNACSARNRGCLAGTFQCKTTGTCISWFFVCDGRKDCTDGSDEQCTSSKCPAESFRCHSSGRCVSKATRCDGVKDCPGGEDEANCQASRRRKCPPDTFQCSDGKCLPEYEFCNAIMGCSDGSDEPAHVCKGRSRRRLSEYCPLRCGNGRCRSSAIACSGRDGCGDGTDEHKCSVCRCPVVQGRSL